MRIIDSHAHVVQYIAGTGAAGELRSIGNGMAILIILLTINAMAVSFGPGDAGEFAESDG